MVLNYTAESNATTNFPGGRTERDLEFKKESEMALPKYSSEIVNSVRSMVHDFRDFGNILEAITKKRETDAVTYRKFISRMGFIERQLDEDYYHKIRGEYDRERGLGIRKNLVETAMVSREDSINKIEDYIRKNNGSFCGDLYNNLQCMYAGHDTLDNLHDDIESRICGIELEGEEYDNSYLMKKEILKKAKEELEFNYNQSMLKMKIVPADISKGNGCYGKPDGKQTHQIYDVSHNVEKKEAYTSVSNKLFKQTKFYASRAIKYLFK